MLWSEQRRRAMPQQSKKALQKRVGLDQGPVEVDAQRNG